MSTGWSIWIIALAALNLTITLVLFIWAQKVKIPTQEDGTTGHVWAHGVLKESVRKLPGWWVWISALSLVFAFVYLAMFPSFGKYPGVLNWSSEERLARETENNMQNLQPLLDRAVTASLNELAADQQAVIFGKRVFDDNCAACHGYDGKGNKVVGAPDLTIGAWLYGGDDDALLHTVRQGRHGVMPGWEGRLSDAEIRLVSAWVRHHELIPEQ